MHAASIRRELLTLGLIAGVAIAFADGASKTLRVAISTAETSFASLTGQKRSIGDAGEIYRNRSLRKKLVAATTGGCR